MSSSSNSGLDYEGKVVLVTGSTSGIGQATALMFAQNGASIVLHGNDEKEASNTFELFFKKENIPKERIHYIDGDLEKEPIRDQLVMETIEKFGRLDVLINNVGATALRGNPDYFSMDALRYIFEINVVCVADLTQKCVPYLMKNEGSIVNVSAVLATRPSYISHWYGITKAAVDQYTRNAAGMYAQAGIRVNAVRPGAIKTPIYEKHGLPKLTKCFVDTIQSAALQHRWAEPREVASVIEFLANNKKSSFVTGEIYGVDGGLNVSFMHPPPEFSELVKDLGYQSNGLMPKPENK